MRSIVLASVVGLAAILMVSRAQAGGCGSPCGGCSDPCAQSPGGYCGPLQGPTQGMKVVLVPEYQVVKRSVCCTEYKEETRTRPVTVKKSVPVEEEKVLVETVYVPKTETKTIEYTVSVPIKEERTKQYTTTVPVWKEVQETYTVKVPQLVEVEETYSVRVPVVEDVPCNYTVMVPYADKRTVMKTVTNAVPVEKTRTITHCVPVANTSMVKKDYGCWETRLVNVPCGNCGTRTVCKKVWVPKIVEEEVTCVKPTYETQEVKYVTYQQTCQQVAQECASIRYMPEVRQGTKKVVKYTEETRSRKRTDVKYVEETRTRTKNVLSFEEKTHTETYPVIRYEQQTRTKEVSYTVKVPEQRVKKFNCTRYDCVPETKIQEYTVCVPVPVVKEVDVQICRMVPKVVATTDAPCGCPAQRGCGCR
jgi:hypothetical protein